LTTSIPYSTMSRNTPKRTSMTKTNTTTWSTRFFCNTPTWTRTTLETSDAKLTFQWQEIRRPSILVVSNTTFPLKWRTPTSMTSNKKSLIISITSTLAYTSLRVLDSGKTFFIKYLTHHLIQTTEKKILLCAPTGAAATKLSPNASTIHMLFRLTIRGPLYALQQPNLTLQRLQLADVIIVDEMSMMTTIQLTTIYSRLKQVSKYNSDLFHSKILLCMGDMAQLPPICFYTVTDSEPFCRRCCIINYPIWTSGKYFTLINSVRHSKDPEYLHFLNIISKR
jgi:hypothetical protein